ncbi:hypothetical protein Tsp_09002 [Trichinella spiralis]|uniref:hypothetical protein n=1 Tax=Trichinella spiralis TaxID=6334 RepID=UPI0001EFC36F|nr:hypothetical protein Tsp_09002 [Trichinella spiralis]
MGGINAVLKSQTTFLISSWMSNSPALQWRNSDIQLYAPMAALAVTLSQQRRTSLRRKNQFITAHEQQFLLCCWKASKSTVPDAVYHALELVPHWKVTGGFYLGEGIACQLIVNLLKDFPRTVV